MLLNFLACLLIGIGITKAYGALAVAFGTSISLITILTFLLSMFVLIFGQSLERFKIDRYWFFTLFALLIIGPLIIMFSTGTFTVRAVLLQFYYLVTFQLAYHFTQKVSSKLLQNVILISSVITLSAGFLSVFYPTLFFEMAILAEAESTYFGRAFGLYLQPNSFGIAVNLCFILTFIVSRNIKLSIYLYPFFLIAIILSGSRTNMLGFGIVSVIYFYFYLKYHFTALSSTFTRLLPVLLISVLILFPKFYSSIQGDDFKYLVERLDFVVNLFVSGELDSVVNDGSFNDRFEYQQVYIERINEKPILGHGLGIQYLLKERGEIIDSAHNTFLEYLLQGGVFYLSFLMLFIIYSFYYAKFITKYKRLKYGYICFIVFMNIYFIFSTTFLTERIVYVVLGVCVGMAVKLRRDSYDN